MNVPEVQIIEGEHPLFVIERYDRNKDGDQVKRLHQQDFCQAIGITSDEKYEAEGGPDLEDVYNLMLENVTARKRIESSFRFLDWVCFNLTCPPILLPKTMALKSSNMEVSHGKHSVQ